MIEMKPVLSSHILAVGHDADKNEMVVEFVDGATVAYPGVPANIADRIATASSPGAALHALVKSKGAAHKYLAAPLRPPRRRQP